MGPLLTKVPPEIGAWAVGEMFPGMEELQNSVSPHCSRDWDYLAMFGVDPAHQGKGIGSAFLQHERAWISGPIGLATQTEQNVRRQESSDARCGFTRRTGGFSRASRSTPCRTASRGSTGSLCLSRSVWSWFG